MRRPMPPGGNPAAEMIRRLERVERSDSHPSAVLGFTTTEIGVFTPLLSEDFSMYNYEQGGTMFAEGHDGI